MVLKKGIDAIPLSAPGTVDIIDTVIGLKLQVLVIDADSQIPAAVTWIDPEQTVKSMLLSDPGQDKITLRHGTDESRAE